MGEVQHASAVVSLGDGQGWAQVAQLGLAFVLSSLIGLEREMRQKSAGLRTHTIVGLGAALFTLVGRYGFSDATATIDPSRVAAQIVTGIGFIGGGLIFVRRDAVQGLTTAATIWLTAAVAMACAASLPLLAVLATAAYFLVASGYRAFSVRLPGSRHAPSHIRLTYAEGSGAMRRSLAVCTEHGFSVTGVHVDREQVHAFDEGADRDHRRDHGKEEERYGHHVLAVSVLLDVVGTGRVADLAAALSEVEGVLAVGGGDINAATE